MAEELSGVPAHQLDILQRMSNAVVVTNPGNRADVAVDALIGYSLRGAPRGRTARLIDQIRNSADAVISLDTPSGLDVTTGATPGVAVRADATLTLALPKTGLRSAEEVGDLYVADIAVPPQVMLALGVVPPDFARASVLQIAR